jgi:hypothetical protein
MAFSILVGCGKRVTEASLSELIAILYEIAPRDVNTCDGVVTMPLRLPFPSLAVVRILAGCWKFKVERLKFTARLCRHNALPWARD